MSGTSLWVGLVTFAAMIPRVLVTPFSGYLADRFDRRKVLALMFGLNLLFNLVLGIVVMTGVVTVWLVVVLALFNGSIRAAQMPAGGALIPNLVPRRLLLNAIALNQATMNGSRLLGPLAIAPFMAIAGLEAAFFVCTGFYAISLVQTLRIRTSSTGEVDRNRSFVSNMLQGLVYVYQRPVLRALVIITLFHCGMTMSFESLLPVLSDQRLSASGAGFSYLMMAVGLGALITIVGIAGVTRESTKGRLFLSLGVLSGLAPALLALSTGMPMALLGAVAMGASQGGFMTLTHTMMQALTDDSVRGRVSAVYSVHIGGTMATVNLVNGGLADYVDAAALLMAAGLGFVAVILASWLGVTLRRIYTGGLQTAVAAD
jgi:MFS family permease